jgi:YD repeat-containing protein
MVAEAMSLGFAAGGVIWLSGSAVVSAQTYTYDAVGRVVGVVYPNGAQVTYSYDKAGNRITETTVVGVGPASTGARVFLEPVGPAPVPSPAAAQPARRVLPERNRTGESATPRDSAGRVDRTP